MTYNPNALCIYVAGPMFSSGRLTQNVHEAVKVADRLRAAGFQVFLPHIYAFWDAISPHDDVDFWLDADRYYLERCDAMLRIQGHSEGGTKEEQWAKALWIPIYHHQVFAETFYEPPPHNGVWQLISAAATGTLKKREAFTLARLQVEQKAWADKNFPGHVSHQPLLGVVEESGELADAMLEKLESVLVGHAQLQSIVGRLAHAHLKREQGIRGTPQELNDKLKDAVGDIVVFLANYCSTMGFDMQQIVEETWAEVSKRDWAKKRAENAAAAVMGSAKPAASADINARAPEYLRVSDLPAGWTRHNVYDREITHIATGAKVQIAPGGYYYVHGKERLAFRKPLDACLVAEQMATSTPDSESAIYARVRANFVRSGRPRCANEKCFATVERAGARCLECTEAGV